MTEGRSLVLRREGAGEHTADMVHHAGYQAEIGTKWAEGMRKQWRGQVWQSSPKVQSQGDVAGVETLLTQAPLSLWQDKAHIPESGVLGPCTVNKSVSFHSF